MRQERFVLATNMKKCLALFHSFLLFSAARKKLFISILWTFYYCIHGIHGIHLIRCIGCRDHSSIYESRSSFPPSINYNSLWNLINQYEFVNVFYLYVGSFLIHCVFFCVVTNFNISSFLNSFYSFRNLRCVFRFNIFF